MRGNLVPPFCALRGPVIALALAGIFTTAALADQTIVRVGQPEQKARAVAAPQATAIARLMLLRIDDALRSGNYSVLRDLAAPSLHDTVTPADLAILLAPLRDRRLELTAASVLDPVFTEAIVVSDGAKMRLMGYLPTAPQRISFEFVLHASGGMWLLSEVAISASEVVPSGASAPPLATPRQKVPGDRRAAASHQAAAVTLKQSLP